MTNLQPIDLHDAAIHETRRLIRMRHYAYRTEQTYLGWLSQYGAFIAFSALLFLLREVLGQDASA